MPAARNMSSPYYEIYNNVRAKFERTGYIGKTRYNKWEGLADQRAHMIAKSYMDIRNKKKQEADNGALNYVYEYLEIENKKNWFNNEDYKHVHGYDYDPHK